MAPCKNATVGLYWSSPGRWYASNSPRGKVTVDISAPSQAVLLSAFGINPWPTLQAHAVSSANTSGDTPQYGVYSLGSGCPPGSGFGIGIALGTGKLYAGFAGSGTIGTFRLLSGCKLRFVGTFEFSQMSDQLKPLAFSAR